MTEDQEESWIRALNHFDSEVWPHLFKDRGYTKGEAMIIWRLCSLDEAVEALRNDMKPKDEDWT